MKYFLKKLIVLSFSSILLIGVLSKTANSSESANSRIQDNRIPIILSPENRNLVLAEMRLFLLSVQQITQGIADDNMKLIYSAARKSGRAAQAEVPPSLAKSLPTKFKRLGFDTHLKFDQLAIDAKDLGDSNYSASQLATLMENCLSCHATYRFKMNK